jgi:hypothetical protein
MGSWCRSGVQVPLGPIFIRMWLSEGQVNRFDFYPHIFLRVSAKNCPIFSRTVLWVFEKNYPDWDLGSKGTFGGPSRVGKGFTRLTWQGEAPLRIQK